MTSQDPRHPQRRPAAWLLSAYQADSHAAWSRWLQTALTGIDWRLFELPGRHFRWRIRGNPLSWWKQMPDAAPDLLVATSMVDLATLKGLNPQLVRVPSIYYFHENQFAYPRGEHQVKCLEPQMVQLYGALAADRVVFNSTFNRDSFLHGVDALVARLPDAVPSGVGDALASRSSVLPVPIVPPVVDVTPNPQLIVWNHRWEYDKAPELFADAMLALAARGAEFQLALLGARPQQTPAALQRLRRELGERIVSDGHLPRARYLQVIASGGIVVSTALHEFQGLAVMEAVAAGCRPLVPDALCYREQYPHAYRYPAGDLTALVDVLNDWLTRGRPAAVSVDAWHSGHVQPRWQALLDALGTPGC